MFFYDINIPSHHGYICQKRFFDTDYTSRMHWHSCIELEIFLKGTGTQQYGNLMETIHPGDVWLFSTEASHQINLSKGTQNINIAIEPDILHEKLRNKLSLPQPLHCTLDEKDMQTFLSKTETLLYEQEHQEVLSRVKATAVINDLLVDVVRKSTSENTPINNPMIREMIDYLQLHHRELSSLTDFAKVFSLTPNYCGHIFKKYLGVSYNDYLNLLKLKSACKALLNTSLSIREIAADSGFSSVEYFYAIFKKFYGLTPAKYRTLTSAQIVDTAAMSRFNSV